MACGDLALLNPQNEKLCTLFDLQFIVLSKCEVLLYCSYFDILFELLCNGVYHLHRQEC